MRVVDRDNLFAWLVLAVSSIAAWMSFGYDADSSWFPRVLSVFLIVMSVALSLGSRGRQPVALAARGQVRIAAMVFAGAVLYAISIQYLSFEIVNYVFLVATMFFFGQRNPYVIVIVSLGVMLLIKLLFFVMLDVPRPLGVLL